MVDPEDGMSVSTPGARVIHRDGTRTYGRGVILHSPHLQIAGTRQTVFVMFDGARAKRLVRTCDLSPEPALPLAARGRRLRIIWPEAVA
jgi:hypothetical protein